MTTVEWEARAEMAVGQFIRRHLQADPPPAGSVVADDLAKWAGLLTDDGRARLESAGVRPLRVAAEVIA